MKLVYCRECDDVVRLFDDTRKCECGKTSGRYKPESETHAEFSGPCVPFALSNTEFQVAVFQRNKDRSIPFFGWVPTTNDPKFEDLKDGA